MFDSRRQHPIAAITKALDIIRENFISLLVLVFVTSGGSESMISLFGILSVVAILLIAGILSWLRFTYRVVEGELRIEQGIFVRKKLYLSKERIQVIDIKAGLVQRLFGLVEVEVKTAGSSSKEAKISAISRERAEKLKAELRRPTGEYDEVEEESGQTEMYKITGKDLVVAACTSGSFGIALSIIGTLFSQLDQVLSEQQMMTYLEALVPASISTYMIVYIIIFLIIISWLLSFLGTIIKHFGFTLTVKKQELVIKQGLFEQRQLTIPFNRIQAIQIKEGLMRQPFGYATLILESAGYGEQQENSTTLYPLIPKKDVDRFLQDVVPEYARRSLDVSPPCKALRRYLVRMALLSLFFIIPGWFFIPYGIYSWFLLVPFLLLGLAQFRDARIGKTDRTLALQFRLLSKTTAIVQKKRIQSVSLTQNPFQKRLHLLSYGVTVASGNQGRTFTIRELEKTEGAKFFNWVSPVFSEEDNLQPAERPGDSYSPREDRR